jgi:hypothetical protein
MVFKATSGAALSVAAVAAGSAGALLLQAAAKRNRQTIHPLVHPFFIYLYFKATCCSLKLNYSPIFIVRE